MPKVHAGTSTKPSRRPTDQATPRQTRTSSPVVWWLFAANCVVVGWAPVLPGGERDNSVHEGKTKPASSTTSLHWRAVWKQGTPPTSKCLIIDSAMIGCLFLTNLSESAQLAKQAALLTLCALESPNPPADKANVAITCAPSGADSVPKMLLKHLHEPLRQLWFNSPQPEVCPRGTTHEEEQERCLNVLDPWMRWNKVACSLLFASRKSRMNSGWPMGTPNTLRPCWLGGNC